MSLNNDPPRSQIPTSVLDRYLAGTATAEERARVESWWRATSVPDLVGGVLHAQAPGAEDVAQVWDRIRIGASLGEVSNAADRKPFNHRVASMGARPLSLASKIRGALGSRSLRKGVGSTTWYSTLRLAGIWTVVVLLMVVTFVTSAKDSKKPAVAAQRIVTGPGERATVTLADGSIVTLAPRTTLQLLAFNERERTLSLQGEAYFHVVDAVTRPFTVHIGAVTTHVLGTAFDIMHYAGDSGVRVAVINGKVLVRGGPFSRMHAVATAGMVAHATDSTVTTTTATAIDDYTNWTEGPLAFHGTTVREMLTVVGRWYGYHFKMTDSTLADRHVDLELNDRSTSEMFKAIQLLLGVRMTFEGAVITLHPERRVLQPTPPRRRILSPSPSSTEYGR